MEIKKQRFKIKYNGGIVIVSADTIEEAMERYKELRIETCTHDITIVKDNDLYQDFVNSKRFAASRSAEYGEQILNLTTKL